MGEWLTGRRRRVAVADSVETGRRGSFQSIGIMTSGDYRRLVEAAKRKRVLPWEQTITHKPKEGTPYKNPIYDGGHGKSIRGERAVGLRGAARKRSSSKALRKAMGVKLAVLQHHSVLVRVFLGEALESEVGQKAGRRYKDDDSHYIQWRTGPGSLRIGEIRNSRVTNPHRFTRPLSVPFTRASTSSGVARLASPGIVCFRHEAAVAYSSAARESVFSRSP